MRNYLFKSTLFGIVFLVTSFSFGQTINEESLIGTWEKEGTLMKKDGWVLPHKHSAPDCGKDHTQFLKDNSGKEATYTQTCDLKEKTFQWQLENNILILSRGKKTIKWHIISLENDELKVGIQVRANSKNKLYIVYKKRT